ncbi:serpin family protein [Pleomorphochaeta sp. DL1XJH-081]|uniref:serpin family protein n=1 Tax=Pleomorphochaeta sp. DL1XJH-081 TaxID=3409690 RepID=UPI003BB498FA
MKLYLSSICIMLLLLISPLSAAAFHEYQDNVQSRNYHNTMTPQQFSSALTKELVAQERDGNLIFSPLSIHTALSMTALGAEGETKRQMEQLLSIPQVLENPFPDATGLSIANSIWVDERYPVSSHFIRQTKELFFAEVETLDFSNSLSPTKINDWVFQKTNGKIDTIIEELKPDMRMILVNAVHFLADWADPFDANDTRDRIFHAPSGDYRTPFLHSERSTLVLDYAKALGIALPYEHGRFVFVALLPPENLTIQQWIATQSSALVENLFKSLEKGSYERVQLAFPKFLDHYEVRLSPMLQQIGMTLPFDPTRANFSGLHADGVSDLFIDDVLHKTFIRVDEKGTEAAAVTAVTMRLTSMMPAGIPIVFDRPFLYGILDKSTGQALFLGVMQTPEAP